MLPLITKLLLPCGNVRAVERQTGHRDGNANKQAKHHWGTCNLPPSFPRMCLMHRERILNVIIAAGRWLHTVCAQVPHHMWGPEKSWWSSLCRKLGDRDSCHFSAVCSRSTGPRAAAASPDSMRDESNSHRHIVITGMHYHAWIYQSSGDLTSSLYNTARFSTR